MCIPYTRCVQHKHLQHNNSYSLYGWLVSWPFTSWENVKFYLHLALAWALFPGAQKTEGASIYTAVTSWILTEICNGVNRQLMEKKLFHKCKSGLEDFYLSWVDMKNTWINHATCSTCSLFASATAHQVCLCDSSTWQLSLYYAKTLMSSCLQQAHCSGTWISLCIQSLAKSASTGYKCSDLFLSEKCYDLYVMCKIETRK